MATLTGFKQVGDSAKKQQNNKQTNGQQNPVFVFDEVDVGNASEDDNNQQTTNEEFADASSQSPNEDPQKKPQPQPQQQQKVNINRQSQSDRKSQGAKPASSDSSTSSSSEQSSRAPADPPHLTNGANSEVQSSEVQRKQKNISTVAINMSPEETKDKNSDQQKQPSTPPEPNRKSAAGSASNMQQARQQRAAQNSLNPNARSDEDNVSVSMLAIDCVGTGKSPRTPRRSPLMALFKGKPRESVRRMYTDEDQFEIEWANVCLQVQKKWYQKFSLSNLLLDDANLKPAQPKLILKNVDGRIRSGEITAVLGPSGAGKTSLINSLFGKYRSAIHGSIRVTGAPSKKHLTVCTIPQSDYLIGYLTTEETLWFASRLKNCEDDFNHDRNIERVIELLGLQRCRNTRINKLSGGQYKRVSIAQEMLSSPDILVLDEPTSGLDSLTCYRTVKVLRDLVEASKAHNLVNPMSIILTIHQPHREVLDLFHSVYIMAVGGQTMYQGPPNLMEECINKYSGVRMPDQGYNPASFMVELASEEFGRQPIDAMVARQRMKFKETTKHHYNYDFTDITGESDQQKICKTSGSASDIYSSQNNVSHKKGDSTISLCALEKDKYVEVDLVDSKGNAQATGSKDIDSRIMTPRSGKNSDGVFWRHVSLMSKRCFLSNTRDPLLFTIRVGAHIFIPLVVALIYGPKMGVPNGCPFYKPEIDLLEYASMGVEEIEEKHDDIRIQFQNVGLHFMIYYAFGLCMLAFTAISFPLIMHVLIKEIRNGWYSLATFIVGKMLAEMPMALILPPISVGIVYSMTGQPSSYLQWRYMVQSLILILIVMIAEAKGLVFGAICMNSMQTAVFAASVSTVPFILLSGFLIRIHEVPYILQHLAKFSYFKHSVEALIITRYGYGMCDCDPALIPPGGTPRIVGIPPQIMSLTDYYITSYVQSDEGSEENETTTETNIVGNNRNIDRIIEAVTTLPPEVENIEQPTTTEPSSRRRTKRATTKPRASTLSPQVSTTSQPTTTSAIEKKTTAVSAAHGTFFDKLAALLTRANAFGYSIHTCADVEPFTMKDMKLHDDQLPSLIGYLFLYIVVLKFLSYLLVEVCVKLKL